jgi:electron transport complex protein RnfC
MAKLYTFPGGLKLEGHKAISTSQPISKANIPDRLFVPLNQNIGSPAECIVKKGQRVLKGQMIGRVTDYVAVPVHAPSSGTIIDIQKFPAAHASGLPSDVIIIEPDGKDEWLERKPLADISELDPSELRNMIRCAGIVGLGGAAFPTFIKLNPVGHQIKTLILNGAECEPYISCDDMLMRERPHEIIDGAKIMRHALNAESVIIAVEDNKPEAISSLQTLVDDLDWIEVQSIPAIYPTGGERQLVKVLTGKDVPSHGLPLDLDLVVSNVATAASVHHALDHQQPLISRIITVTGSGVSSPRNIEALIGTPMSDLIEMAGGYTENADRLIMGGPMMGITLKTDATPVVKASNCLLVQTPADHATETISRPCIRCGECVKVCPVKLLPQQLYWFSQSKNLDGLQTHHLFDCIECGCCSVVCPSHIPLVQYFRYGKSESWKKEQEMIKSDRARERTEARTKRLERIKAEKKAQHAARAKKTAAGDDRKKEIQAAVARTKAKKAENAGDTDNLST